MSEEELQEKSLGLAKQTLNGKSDLERTTVLHQHIGSRAMGDMVIETFEPSSGKSSITYNNNNMTPLLSHVLFSSVYV